MEQASQIQKTLAAVSIWLVIGTYAWGGPTKASETHVSVDLVLPKNVFFLGEDIQIEMLAVNSGKEKLAIALDGVAEGPGKTHLIVQDEAGRPLDYVGWHSVSLRRGEKFRAVPPGGKIRRKVNLTGLYRIDRACKYRIRCYATVGEAKKKRIYSKWKDFKVVTGKEVFRKDVKVACGSVKKPKREVLSLVIYASPKFSIAYWNRVFEKDGKKATERRSLGQVDPKYKPQVIRDSRGLVHMFVAKRPLTKPEIEKRFKEFPNSYKEHMEWRFYVWCEFCPGEQELWLHKQRPVGVRKKDNTELRLVKAKNGTVMIHEFTAKGKDLGAYPPRKKRKIVKGTSSGVATQRVP